MKVSWTKFYPNNNPKIVQHQIIEINIKKRKTILIHYACNCEHFLKNVMSSEYMKLRHIFT